MKEIAINTSSVHYLKETTLREALTESPDYHRTIDVLMNRLGWEDDYLHLLEHGLLKYAICGAQDEINDIGGDEKTRDTFEAWFGKFVVEQEAKKKALESAGVATRTGMDRTPLS